MISRILELLIVDWPAEACFRSRLMSFKNLSDMWLKLVVCAQGPCGQSNRWRKSGEDVAKSYVAAKPPKPKVLSSDAQRKRNLRRFDASTEMGWKLRFYRILYVKLRAHASSRTFTCRSFVGFHVFI
jgi:hypothetical protein